MTVQTLAIIVLLVSFFVMIFLHWLNKRTDVHIAGLRVD